jgi:hypothetical protein
MRRTIEGGSVVKTSAEKIFRSRSSNFGAGRNGSIDERTMGVGVNDRQISSSKLRSRSFPLDQSRLRWLFRSVGVKGPEHLWATDAAQGVATETDEAGAQSAAGVGKCLGDDQCLVERAA